MPKLSAASPVHLAWPLLTFLYAVAVMVWTPGVVLAVSRNDHCVLPVASLSLAVWAPVISTHFVSLSVVTFSVSAAPGSANRAPLTTRVPAPPVNDAPVALAAWATDAVRAIPAGHGSSAAIPASASPRRTRRLRHRLARDPSLRCEATDTPCQSSFEVVPRAASRVQPGLALRCGPIRHAGGGRQHWPL